MSVINTNTKALFTQNALKTSARQLSVAMQQLSTGKRINSARDDAAGLAISDRMTQQIRSINQAVRNAGDAVSLIQTAEGATNSITDMLQRMRELAIQAINDTNANDQRSYLNLEFQQLKEQIDAISTQTEWNGFPILNGTTGIPVGERPVYKATSVGVTEGLRYDVAAGGATTDVGGVVTITKAGGLFLKGGSLEVEVDGTGEIDSAVFTGADGNAITLDHADPNVISLSGQVVTLKAGSGLVNADVTLTTSAANLNAVQTISVSASQPQAFTTVDAMQADDIIINGITVGASHAISDTLSTVNNAASAIAKAAAINVVSDDTGVVAVVNQNLMTGSYMTPSTSTVTGTITINGYSTETITSVENNTRANRAAVVTAINAIKDFTGVEAINTDDDTEGITLVAADGRNIAVSFTNQASGGSTDADFVADFSARFGVSTGVQIGTYSLESKVEAPVVVTTIATGQPARSGLRVGDYSQNVSTYISAARPVVADPANARTLDGGDLLINGVAIRATTAEDDPHSPLAVDVNTSQPEGSALAMAAAINDASAQTGVRAEVVPPTITGTTTTTTVAGVANGTAKTLTLVINGTEMDIDVEVGEAVSDRLDKVIDAVNKAMGGGVIASKSMDEQGLVLTTSDGRNLAVWHDDAFAAAEFGLSGSGMSTEFDLSAGALSPIFVGAQTAYGSLKLISDKPFELSPGTNGFTADGDFGRLGFDRGIFGGEVDAATSKMSPPRTGRLSFHVGAGAGQTITIDLADYGRNGPITGDITGDLDLPPEQRLFRIDDPQAARDVLAKLDVAMDKVNGNRAVMGAVMNRLDYIMDNLRNVAMNTEASRSQIEDADYAAASTDLARTQIMQQAATAVLAQANMDQQTVLKLLQ